MHVYENNLLKRSYLLKGKAFLFIPIFSLQINQLAMRKDRVKILLDQIKTFNIWNVFKESHPEADLSNLEFGGWKTNQIAGTLDRILGQFEERLTHDDFELLPDNFQNIEIDPGVNRVTNYLSHIYDNLTQKNFEEVVKSLKWLASYQVAYGFWNKSIVKVHDPKTLDLKNKVQEIEVLETKIAAGITNVNNLKSDLEKSYEELKTFYSQKQNELSVISQTRDDIQSKQNQASSILVEINNYKSQSDAALANTNTTRDESKKIADEGKTFLDDFIKKSEALKTSLDTYIEDALKKLGSIDEANNHIKSKRDYIDLKEEEIIKLAAQASDGSLGHTFDKRQEKLGKTANLWMAGTWGMTILLFVWMYVVFTCLSETRYEPQWINPLINTLKTIPAFVILVFIARQYTKERNLQEEYAFKASIAMTLTAYADEIAREKDEDRRSVIMDTIEKVYKMPKITNESISLFGIKQKQIEAIAEKTADTVNKVIDKTPVKK